MAQIRFTKENINEYARANREYEYKRLADPLFMKVQRGEASIEDWKAVVAEIKAKYPYVTEDKVIETTEAVSININQ